MTQNSGYRSIESGRRNCHSARPLPANFSHSRDQRVWFGRRNCLPVHWLPVEVKLLARRTLQLTGRRLLASPLAYICCLPPRFETCRSSSRPGADFRPAIAGRKEGVASGGRRNCHSAHPLPAKFSHRRDQRVWLGRRNCHSAHPLPANFSHCGHQRAYILPVDVNLAVRPQLQPTGRRLPDSNRWAEGGRGLGRAAQVPFRSSTAREVLAQPRP